MTFPRPVCPECDTEMHRYEAQEGQRVVSGWSCDDCGWSEDDE
jgi:predicted RNA-binding Zn-ribbon protein involved in translation (DUF1610 family)